MRRAGLRIDAWRSAADIWDPPALWRQRVERVEAEMRARHAEESEWQVAEHQSDLIARATRKIHCRAEFAFVTA